MTDLTARLDGIVQTSQEVATAAVRTRELVSQPGQASEALRSLNLLADTLEALSADARSLLPSSGEGG